MHTMESWMDAGFEHVQEYLKARGKEVGYTLDDLLAAQADFEREMGVKKAEGR